MVFSNNLTDINMKLVKLQLKIGLLNRRDYSPYINKIGQRLSLFDSASIQTLQCTIIDDPFLSFRNKIFLPLSSYIKS